MRPLSIELTDFGSYAEAKADLRMLSLAAIVGKNGVGKSTILEAIRVALFGRKAGSLDDLIRTGASSFRVLFDFEVDGTTFRVSREQTKTGQKAALYVWSGSLWEPVSDTKVSEVDAKLVQILGCGYQEFTMAHHIPQGSLGAFAALDPADRKAWLIANLPMQLWTDLEAEAKVRAQRLTTRAAGLEGQITALIGIPFDFEQNADEIEDVRRALATNRTALETTADEYQRAAESNATFERLRAEHAAASVKVADLSGRRGKTAEARIAAHGKAQRLLEQTSGALPDKIDLSAAHEEREKLRDEEHGISALNDSVVATKKSTETALSSRETAARQLEQAYRALQDFQQEDAPVCSTCGQTVAGEARANMEAVLYRACDAARDAMKVAETAHQEAADAHAEALSKAEGADQRLVTVSARIGQISILISGAAKIDEQHAERVRLLGDLMHATKDAERLNDEYAALNDEYLEAAKVAEAAEKAVREADRTDLTAYRESMKALEETIATDERTLTSLVAARDKATDTNEKLRVTREEKAQVNAELAVVNLLVKAYGKKGIPARIIANAVLEIEQYANAFLGRFADGLTLEFQTQADNKSSDTIKETLEILVTNATGTRKLERYSGGEKTRIYFALSVALADFVARTGGTTISSFAVDEPEYLDADGLNELVECLHVLSRTIPCVMLISHYDGVSDSIPQRIRVTRGPAGSRMEVLA